MISTLVLEKLVHKGCDAYFTYVHDTSIVGSTIGGISIVKDSPDVFPKKLLGLPPNRDVESGIDVLPGTALV